MRASGENGMFCFQECPNPQNINKKSVFTNPPSTTEKYESGRVCIHSINRQSSILKQPLYLKIN